MKPIEGYLLWLFVLANVGYLFVNLGTDDYAGAAFNFVGAASLTWVWENIRRRDVRL